MTGLKKPRALLLDAGNTVVFLNHEALAEAARCQSLEVPAEALRRAEPIAKRRYEASLSAGMSHEDGWHLHMRVIYEVAGLDTTQAERAAHAAWRAHHTLNLWRDVPPELPGALARARGVGMLLGIVSNSEGKLRELFAQLQLAPLFDVIVDSGIEGVRKPEPEIFRRALERLGVAAEDALYAGDIPHVDVDGARAAGVDAALIDPFDHYPAYRGAPRFASVAEMLAGLGV